MIFTVANERIECEFFDWATYLPHPKSIIAVFHILRKRTGIQWKTINQNTLIQHLTIVVS